MKARTAVVSAVAAICLTLAGCGDDGGSGDNDNDSGSGSGSGTQIGFSVAKLEDSFQVLLVAAVEKTADEQSVDLLPVVNANNDPAKQNEDISTLITRGVAGLIVGPIDSAAIVPAIEKANDAGIPVVTIDSGADGGEIAMTVKADNKFMGAAGCDVIGAAVDGQGTVLNLQGDLSSTNGRDRSDGFTECMADKYPDVEVISKRMDWSPELCSDVAQTVLSTTDIDGIYAASETICLEPVSNALEAIDRLAPIGDPNHMPFAAIDGTPAAHDAVRDGILDAVISQPLNDYAKWAVYWVNAAAQGEEIAEGPTDHDSNVVKDGNAFYDLLPSPTVTQENVDDPNLWGNG